MIKWGLLLIITGILSSLFSYDIGQKYVLLLNNGNVISGKVIEENKDQYLKLESNGIIVTYTWQEIRNSIIDDGNVYLSGLNATAKRNPFVKINSVSLNKNSEQKEYNNQNTATANTNTAVTTNSYLEKKKQYLCAGLGATLGSIYATDNNDFTSNPALDASVDFYYPTSRSLEFGAGFDFRLLKAFTEHTGTVYHIISPNISAKYYVNDFGRSPLVIFKFGRTILTGNKNFMKYAETGARPFFALGAGFGDKSYDLILFFKSNFAYRKKIITLYDNYSDEYQGDINDSGFSLVFIKKF